MSPRVWKDRLHDTLEGVDATALAVDAKTLKAAVASFAVIDQADTHLPEEVTNL